MGFTDHDRDLDFQWRDLSRKHRSLSDATRIRASALRRERAKRQALLSDESLTETDLLNGLYDGASVETWLVDWTNVDGSRLAGCRDDRRGTRGEIAFCAELRSSAHLFDQQQGRAFQRSCSADLGDARCGFDVMAPGFHATGVVAAFVGGAIDVDLSRKFRQRLFHRRRADLHERRQCRTPASRSNRIGRKICARASRYGRRRAARSSPGDAVLMTAGCDKSPTTCRAEVRQYRQLSRLSAYAGQ